MRRWTRRARYVARRHGQDGRTSKCLCEAEHAGIHCAGWVADPSKEAQISALVLETVDRFGADEVHVLDELVVCRRHGELRRTRFGRRLNEGDVVALPRMGQGSLLGRALNVFSQAPQRSSTVSDRFWTFKAHNRRRAAQLELQEASRCQETGSGDSWAGIGNPIRLGVAPSAMLRDELALRSGNRLCIVL